MDVPWGGSIGVMDDLLVLVVGAIEFRHVERDARSSSSSSLLSPQGAYWYII